MRDSGLDLVIYLHSPVLRRTWEDLGLIQDLQVDFRIHVVLPFELMGMAIELENKGIAVTVLPRFPTRFASFRYHLAWLGRASSYPSFREKRWREFVGNYRPMSVELSASDNLRLLALSLLHVTTPARFFRMIFSIPVLAKVGYSVTFPFFLREKRAFEAIWDSKVPKSRVLLIPSAGNFEYLDFLILTSRSRQTLTIVSPDNWDNVTSKSVFVYRPDFITVMGEISKTQAMELHGFKNKQVLVTGLPKFDLLRQPNSDSNQSSGRKRILYAGYSQPHDEQYTMTLIADWINDRSSASRLAVRYREHPVRVKPVFTSKKSRSDPWLEQTAFSSSELKRNWGLPSLGHSYADDLAAADLVVGPPTTFLLEALLLGKSVIVDAIDDRIHWSTAGRVLDRYVHMSDLFGIRDVKVARNASQLVNLLDAWDLEGGGRSDWEGLNRLIAPGPFLGNLSSQIRKILPTSS